MTSLSFRWRHQLTNWRVFILNILSWASCWSDGWWRHRLSRFMTSLKEKKLSWIFMNTEKGFLFTTPFKNIHESCRLNLEMNCWSSIGFKVVINYEVIASKKTNKNSMKQFMISVTLVSSLQFFVVHQFQWMINYLNSEVLHFIHLYVKKWKCCPPINMNRHFYYLKYFQS